MHHLLSFKLSENRLYHTDCVVLLQAISIALMFEGSIISQLKRPFDNLMP